MKVRENILKMMGIAFGLERILLNLENKNATNEVVISHPISTRARKI